MQSAGDKEPEAMATCPYNPAHRLPRFRMKRHLVKCRLNSSTNNDLMVTCPLNNEHRIPQPEFAFHMETCSSRVDLDRKIQLPEVIDRVTPVQAVDISPPDECWDDAAHPSYDPTKHVTENAILRIKNCEPKAKRREFRLEERSRIGRLNEENRHLMPQARELQMSASKAAVQSRRPVTQSAAAANKQDLDPYKVNDMLKALNEDQQKLLDNLQKMGEGKSMHIFPIEETAQVDCAETVEQQETFSENAFPSLGGDGGWKPGSSFSRVGRGGYAATLQKGRGSKR